MRTKPTILFLTASILVLFINRLHGQQRCGTAEFEANKMSRNPELIFYKENSNRYLQQYRNNVGTNQRLATSNIQIPVVFHLIGDVVIANVLYSKLEDQITILNSAYSGVYGGFNTNIQFCLAKIDPTGVTTTGEDPITGSYPSWDPCAASTASNSNEVLKALTHWEPTQYLNIYIVENISCPSKPILGYSTFPYELSGHPNDDGVVIDYDYFGTTSYPSGEPHIA